MNSGSDSQSPGVIKAPLAVSSAQGLVSTILSEVKVHVGLVGSGYGASLLWRQSPAV